MYEKEQNVREGCSIQILEEKFRNRTEDLAWSHEIPGPKTLRGDDKENFGMAGNWFKI
jgi:hypothetical protein